MTRDEIDIMWQKAMQESTKYGELFTRYHFAKLVAEAEREACAEVCKKHADVYAKLEGNPTAKSAWAACIDNRDAIRARGQA
jgi:hypothetical protein